MLVVQREVLMIFITILVSNQTKFKKTASNIDRPLEPKHNRLVVKNKKKAPADRDHKYPLLKSPNYEIHKNAPFQAFELRRTARLSTVPKAHELVPLRY